jgi:hypothetical protein
MTRWELISTGITGTGETQNGTVTGLTGEVCLQFFDREINFLSIVDLTSHSVYTRSWTQVVHVV